MNIPKAVSERMASIESEIVLIEAEASRQVRLLRNQLDILEFAVSAFAESEQPCPPPAPAPVAITGVFDYEAVISVLRDAPKEGLPKSALPIDHSSRLSVLKRQKIATKLPSGHWALVR